MPRAVAESCPLSLPPRPVPAGCPAAASVQRLALLLGRGGLSWFDVGFLKQGDSWFSIVSVNHILLAKLGCTVVRNTKFHP